MAENKGIRGLHTLLKLSTVLQVKSPTQKARNCGKDGAKLFSAGLGTWLSKENEFSFQKKTKNIYNRMAIKCNSLRFLFCLVALLAIANW